MKVTRFLVMAMSAGLVLSVAQARAELIKINASVKATQYSASGGKIIKSPVTNPTIIGGCTNAPGAQLVGLFDTVAKALVELDVVDSCGDVLCQVATFEINGDCADTGVVNGKQELICPVSMSLMQGGGGALITDVKLSLDSQGAVTGGSLKATGVYEDDSGHPGSIAITAGSGFKPGRGCLQ